MKFVAIFVDENNQRVPREIDISESDLKLDDMALDWSQVDLRLGGNKKDLLLFEVSAHNLDFYIRLDKPVKRQLAESGVESIVTLVGAHKKKVQKQQFGILTFVGSVVGIFVFLFSFRSIISKKIVERIPYDYEQKIGESLSKTALLSNGGKLGNKELQAAVEEMISPLRQVVPRKYADMKISISNSEELNAFATPGGYMSVNLGLLKKSDTCGEVLGVLAHEAAHITERHVLTSLVQTLSMYSVVSFLVGDITGIVATLSDAGAGLLSLSFSQDIESEADEVGLRYLAEMGYGPEGLISFFKKIEEESKNKKETLKLDNENLQKASEHLEKFLSTHPVTDERISHIKGISEILEIKPKIAPCDYSKIKKILETI